MGKAVRASPIRTAVGNSARESRLWIATPAVEIAFDSVFLLTQSFTLTSTRDADQIYLDDLEATCEQKALNFEARQQLRVEEIEAVEKAIEIISSGGVAGNAEQHWPGLLQKSALAQPRADISFPDDPSVTLQGLGSMDCRHDQGDGTSLHVDVGEEQGR